MSIKLLCYIFSGVDVYNGSLTQFETNEVYLPISRNLTLINLLIPLTVDFFMTL